MMTKAHAEIERVLICSLFSAREQLCYMELRKSATNVQM